MKIVVGYNGSGASERALELAMSRAKTYQATVYPVLSLLGESEDEEAEVLKARELLTKARERFEEQQLSCDSRLLIRGLGPGEDIVKFAEDHEADEIIIGVRRKSEIARLLFGSTARFVILNAPCPVTTVR